MQVVSLRVSHPCPFAAPIAALPHARATHLCHRGEEAMLEVHDPEPLVVARLVSEYVRIGGTVVHEEADRTAALIRFARCACCRSGRVIPTVERAGYVFLPPSTYGPDGEAYQFLAEERRLDRRLLGRLPRGVAVDGVGARPLGSLGFEDGFLVPVGSLLGGLTPRQRQAIVAGVVRGYYRIPRTVRTEELARTLGVSRPAYEALLRKAENKLVGAMFPYLTVGEAGESAARPPADRRTPPGAPARPTPRSRPRSARR